MKNRIVTMGEIMLRLSTPEFQRFTQSTNFNATYGGGEANVAASLARYGHFVSFVTKLPNNDLGEAAIAHLRKYAVNTDLIARGGSRLGVYFLETGASVRPSKVIYDRTNSSIATATKEDFDFKEIFKNAKWFHWTGITPAISVEAREVIKKALKTAKKMGIIISVDLNFRKKLWTSKEAQEVMKPLMKYVDYCIGNEEDAALVLGVHSKNTDVTKGKIEREEYKGVLKELVEQFEFRAAIITLRESYSASKNGWSAMAYDGIDYFNSEKYELDIVDRIGGGDSFAAGFINGILKWEEISFALEFAVAASALKHTIHGDFNLVSEEEVLRLVKGDKSGRVQR